MSPDLEKADGIRYGQCSKYCFLDCTIFPFSIYLHMLVPNDPGGFIPQWAHSYAHSKQIQFWLVVGCLGAAHSDIPGGHLLTRKWEVSIKIAFGGWKYSSVVQHMISMHKTLVSIPNTNPPPFYLRPWIQYLVPKSPHFFWMRLWI
jgi:hypothetical protein